MGKARSYEIIEYRKIIMNQICKSKNLIKLLGCEKAEYPEDIIPFNKSFPHEYIPDTITETDRFINFDIKASIDARNKVFKDLTIHFFVVCHRDVVRYIEKGNSYLWYDKVTCELDEIFGETNLLGVGETTMVGNDPYYPQNKFVGRFLTFKVKDFVDGKKYGK